MERTIPRRTTRRGALVLALAVLLLSAAAGCSPKRVVDGGGQPASTGVKKRLTRTEPPPPEARPDAGAPDRDDEIATGALPAPDVRKRAGRPGYQTTPENVRLGMQAATLARQQLGKQYQWGATGPDRFDCSGLTYWVFGQLGVQLPRVSRSQARAGRKVGRSELQAGDLVFFSTQGSRINHVGIYLDDGEFVHAPRRYQPVRIDSLNDSWWRHRFRTARRMR